MAIAQPPKRPLARKRARAHTPAPPTAQPPRQTKPPSGTPTHASSPHTSNASKNTHPWRNASNSPAPHGSASNSNATAPSSTHKSTHHRATTYSTKPPYKPLAAPNRSHHFPHKSPPKPEKSASPTNSHSATNSPVEALFLGLRLLAAYCPPYGSAAVLLPLRNTHVLACYVLGSRLAPATCEHTHAFFWGATPIGGLLPPIRLRCRAIAYRQYARLSVLCSRQPACADYLRAYARFFWGYAPMRSPNTRAGAQSSPKTKKCSISRCSSPMTHKAIPKTKNAASHRGK